MPSPDFDPLARRCTGVLIDLALAEDLGDRGDITAQATIPVDARGSAVFRARSAGIIAGLPVVAMLAERFDMASGFTCLAEDGEAVEPGRAVVSIAGSMRALLAMERTALNFLQRLSGIATLTSRFVSAVSGTRARILDTRKTTPGWRALEKYAVRCGGGENHRLALYDGVLIKDNHLAWLTLSDELDPIGKAVRTARAFAPPGTEIEVEVDSLEQLDRALEHRPEIILVDNFSVSELTEAVRRRNARAKDVRLEASGGVSLGSVAEIARTGVDRISVGALTHSAQALDIGLDFDQAMHS
jgi:nicotinate-nucleotide pyrophosphorylase (carboxylating)